MKIHYDWRLFVEILALLQLARGESSNNYVKASESSADLCIPMMEHIQMLNDVIDKGEYRIRIWMAIMVTCGAVSVCIVYYFFSLEINVYKSQIQKLTQRLNSKSNVPKGVATVNSQDTSPVELSKDK